MPVQTGAVERREDPADLFRSEFRGFRQLLQRAGVLP